MEFALALIGIVTLVYVSLMIWTWVNRTLAERQASYEGRRVAAGQIGTSKDERLAVYQRPELELFNDSLRPSPVRQLALKNQGKTECAKGKPYYDQALADTEEVNRVYVDPAGPMEALKGEVKKTLERMCKSSSATPDNSLSREKAKRCRDAPETDPACPKDKVEKTAAEVSGDLASWAAALSGACVGVGSAATIQDQNWTRCATYWYQRAASEDDDDDRKKFLNRGAYCRCNVEALERHINHTLGDRLEAFSRYADALTARADWGFRKGDCKCVKPSEQPAEFARCQDWEKKTTESTLEEPTLNEPKVTKPTVSEVPPPQPALRGGNRKGCS